MALSMTFTEDEAGILAAALSSYMTEMAQIAARTDIGGNAKVAAVYVREAKALAIRLSHARVAQSNP